MTILSHPEKVFEKVFAVVQSCRRDIVGITGNKTAKMSSRNKNRQQIAYSAATETFPPSVLTTQEESYWKGKVAIRSNYSTKLERAIMMSLGSCSKLLERES